MIREMLACALLAASAITLFCGDVIADDWTVRSPGGRTEISVRTTPEDGLQYHVRLLAGGRERVAVDWWAIEACRLEARELAGVRLGGGGDAV